MEIAAQKCWALCLGLSLTYDNRNLRRIALLNLVTHCPLSSNFRSKILRIRIIFLRGVGVQKLSTSSDYNCLSIPSYHARVDQGGHRTNPLQRSSGRWGSRFPASEWEGRRNSIDITLHFVLVSK